MSAGDSRRTDAAPQLSARRRWPARAIFRRKCSGIAFAMPLLFFMVVAFNLPIVLMLGWSLTNPTPTLRHFAELFEVTVYFKVMGNTVRIGAITTFVCVVLGYPLAYWLRGLGGTARNVVLALVIVPFWISILIRTYAWIVILGNNGMVNRGLLEWGVIGAPLPILYNELGVIIGTVNVLLPFFVLPLYAMMTRVDQRLLQAAASLGASSRTVFWRVFFPLTIPALGAGAILVFILTLGFYITPAVLGGGRVAMVANMLDSMINQVPRWELAAAISTLFMIAIIGFYALSRWLRAQTTA